MSHYRSNLRDIEFNLFEAFDLDGVLGAPPYEEMDNATARQVLSEVERVATGPFADGFVDSDRTPLQLDNDGNVTVPAGINKALDAYFGAGWGALALPAHLGGFGAPKSLAWAASSMLLGANPAALMYAAGPYFGSITDGLVTDEQRDRWVRPWIDRDWGSTMMLTEPDAGSDVGASSTTAVDAGDGTWHLGGTKRFITNGDFDWPENIMHLVLARAVDAQGQPLHGPGTKGLSLFMVPKFWVEPDGSLSWRNPVYARKIEDKMGLKGSSTCEMEFTNASGILVGDRHDGIRQMFKVIEYARMLVGTKAIETLSTGYLNALAYANERVQGADLKQQTDKTAPRVEIINHPDVRRMLMNLKANAEGLRALVFYAASIQDRIAVAEATGDDAAALVARNDLLLPLLKGHGSETSYALLADALQIFGGSGYCTDYPLEQYVRDAKIDTLYEGTTGIQGMDLFFRKIVRDRGATLGALLSEISTFADDTAGELGPQRQQLGQALAEVQQMLQIMSGFTQDDLYKAGLNTTGLLHAVAELVIGWLLLRHAEIASRALPDAPPSEHAFYTGKVAAARWYAAQTLPRINAHRIAMANTDLEAMELDPAAF